MLNFSLPIALLCGRRYLKVCSDCSVTRKGERDDWEHFSHFIAHRISYLFRLPTPSFLQSPWILMPFLLLPHKTGAGDPASWISLNLFISKKPLLQHWDPKVMSPRSQCAPHMRPVRVGCLEGQKWPCRSQLLIFIRWARSRENHQNHCRGFLLAWLQPEFHHPRVFASSISLSLSWAPSCCQGHGAPAVLSSTSLCSRAGELILPTPIWKHSFCCCGKSTERHRIGAIKHGASQGSISSAWRVLHHAKLWLLQPHTSNLLHFSAPVSVVWYRSE